VEEGSRVNQKFWMGVLQAIIVALLLGVMGKVWQTYEQIIELRHDVDVLYGEVNELAQR
jgi:hypothetical protein